MENKQYMYAIVITTGNVVTVRCVCKTQEKAQQILNRLHEYYDGLKEGDPLYGTTAIWEKTEVIEG